MNEIETTYFQIPPRHGVHRWDGRAVTFMNDTFDLDDVNFISSVQAYGGGIQHYYFTIHFSGESKRELRYDFANKSQAIKAQRQLSRAFTATGEYEFIKEESTDTKAN